MWYFTWVLGLGFACAFAVLNAMWLELSCGWNCRLAMFPPNSWVRTWLAHCL